MEFVESVLAQGSVLAVLLVVFAVVGVIITLAKNYHTVAPNQVAVISGRQRKVGAGMEGVQRRGYRVVTGGGFLLWPILERVEYMSLNVMTFPLGVENAPDKNGAPVSVKAIANVKIQSDEGSLALAIERFLGQRTEQIQATAKENLESNLRAIVGTLTIEQLIQDRQNLQAAVIREAGGDLSKLGLGLDLLNIQEVRDEKGYINALGMKQTAEVKRNAEIGAAEAQRDTNIRTAQATQEGETAKAKASQAISDAERERDIIKARNQAQVSAEQARIALIAQRAAAEEQQQVNIAEVEADAARVKAETELQALARERRQAELRATTIVEAEAQREAVLIQADAQQKAAERIGEASRIKSEKEGLGEQAKLTGQAEGRKATAAAKRAEMEAEAAGARATMLAEAEGERARLLAVAEGEKQKRLAEAEGTRALLLAEAEGALEKARAFRELDEAGRLLMYLHASPAAIHALGAAVGTALTPVAESIGKGLGNIDELRIVDMGSSKNGHNVVQDFANLPVETLKRIAEQVHAAGLGPALTALMARAGVTMPESREPGQIPAGQKDRVQ